MIYAGVVELVDSVDLGSSGIAVQVRVLSPAPYRVFITDFSYGHSIFYVLMYEQAFCLLIFYALWVTYSTATPLRVSAV